MQPSLNVGLDNERTECYRSFRTREKTDENEDETATTSVQLLYAAAVAAANVGNDDDGDDTVNVNLRLSDSYGVNASTRWNEPWCVHHQTSEFNVSQVSSSLRLLQGFWILQDLLFSWNI